MLLAACAAIGLRRSSRSPVFAVHVHHHLRAEADADAAHVDALARELGVPLVRRDVHPTRRGKGLANDARELRHAALLDAALEIGASRIALAHHADDRLETLLMHLGRGSGLRGIGSIPWNRRAAPGSGVRVVHPMLGLTRAEIVGCAVDIGVTWREDAGNLDPASVRGMLRTQVIPALRARWPKVAQRASAAADGARAGLLAGRAWFRGHACPDAPTRTMLRDAGPDLACLAVDEWLRGCGVSASWMQVTRIARAACGRAGEPRAFPAGASRVTVRARTLTLERSSREGESDPSA